MARYDDDNDEDNYYPDNAPYTDAQGTNYQQTKSASSGLGDIARNFIGQMASGVSGIMPRNNQAPTDQYSADQIGDLGNQLNQFARNDQVDYSKLLQAYPRSPQMPVPSIGDLIGRTTTPAPQMGQQVLGDVAQMQNTMNNASAQQRAMQMANAQAQHQDMINSLAFGGKMAENGLQRNLENKRIGIEQQQANIAQQRADTNDMAVNANMEYKQALGARGKFQDIGWDKDGNLIKQDAYTGKQYTVDEKGQPIETNAKVIRPFKGTPNAPIRISDAMGKSIGKGIDSFLGNKDNKGNLLEDAIPLNPEINAGISAIIGRGISTGQFATPAEGIAAFAKAIGGKDGLVADKKSNEYRLPFGIDELANRMGVAQGIAKIPGSPFSTYVGGEEQNQPTGIPNPAAPGVANTTPVGAPGKFSDAEVKNILTHSAGKYAPGQISQTFGIPLDQIKRVGGQ